MSFRSFKDGFKSGFNEVSEALGELIVFLLMLLASLLFFAVLGYMIYKAILLLYNLGLAWVALLVIVAYLIYCVKLFMKDLFNG